MRPCPVEGTGSRIPGLRSGALGRQERNDRRNAWYRQTKDNEVRRKGRRKSHIPIVPLTKGNLYRGDPDEGRGMLVMDSWVGHPSGALYLACGFT